MRVFFKHIAIIIFAASIMLILGSKIAQAQAASATDNAYYYAVVVGTDTFPLVYLPEVKIVAQKRISPEKLAELNRLRANVQRVYPYAVTASAILIDVDDHMAKLRTRKEKKDYLKQKESEMKVRFKDELKDLTMTQGSILVKLINRQTGRDCYDIIKQIKGGFNARISQTVASVFDNNLKAQYDPFGADAAIEGIVQEIESQNFYQYQYRGGSQAHR